MDREKTQCHNLFTNILLMQSCESPSCARDKKVVLVNLIWSKSQRFKLKYVQDSRRLNSMTIVWKYRIAGRRYEVFFVLTWQSNFGV